MPVFVHTQDNFNGGEISKALRGATRLNRYYGSAERIQNFVVTKEGNLKYRGGFVYVNNTKDNIKAVMKHFISVNDEKYILEFSSGFLRIYRNNVQVQEIATTYEQETLYQIQTAQDQDALYIIDGKHPPYKLLKTATDTFTLDLLEFEYPPFLPENNTSTTLDSSAKTGNVTIDSSTDIFIDEDVGRYIRIRSGSSVGFAVITAVNSPTQVNATVDPAHAFPTTLAVTTWSLSPIPSGITFFKGRLFLGSEIYIFGSRLPSDDGTTNYEDFTLGTGEEDAFIFSTAMLSPRILWLASNDKTLFGASSDSVLNLGATDISSVISTLNPPDVRIIATDGSINVPPVIKNNTVFYINQSGERLNTINYNFDLQGYQIIETNLLSQDIAENGIIQLALQEGKEDIVWCIRSDGVLLGLNYLPEQEVLPWFRVVAGEAIESVTTISSDEQREDILYISIKRVVNGSTVRHIEYLASIPIIPDRVDYFTDNKEADDEAYRIDVWEAQKNYNNLDSHIVYDGSDSTHSTETMTPSATSGDDILFTAGGSIFSSSDIGREIWEKGGKGRAEIITYISPTQVRCRVLETSSFVSIDTIPAGDWYFTNNVFDGLDHLEGEQVTVLSDGEELGERPTVSGGEVTIQKQASKVTIGLKYTALKKSMVIQGGSANGNSRIKYQKVLRVGLSVLNSLGGEIGTNLYNLSKILFGPTDIYGIAKLPFTGMLDIQIDDNFEKEKHFYILQRSSLPMQIQILTAIIETNESN